MRGRARRCGEESKRLGVAGLRGRRGVPAVKGKGCGDSEGTGGQRRRAGHERAEAGGWADRGAAAKRGDDDAGSWAPRRRRGVRKGGPGPDGTGEERWGAAGREGLRDGARRRGGPGRAGWG